MTKFEDWLQSKDCYGNSIIGEWEKDIIRKRFKQLRLKDCKPNEELIDITKYKPQNYKSNKPILITLSHFLRPCPCGCHKWQYECYLNDCKCCTDECT